jgi:LAO/AO transport system kinase
VPPLDLRRIAQAVTAAENGDADTQRLLQDAYRLRRRVPVVGITGPPGVGKSTLVDRLAVHWADRGEALAVLAIDPSSPYTGGAVLGDRIRMDRAASHSNVFVRSLASRGELGGVARAAHDVVMVLGALEFDRIVLETVGAGQADVSIATLADIVVLVGMPGMGDQVQAAKAGILEIADVYVVNKSDHADAPKAIAHVRANVDLIYPGLPGRNVSAAGATSWHANSAVHRRHGSGAETSGYWRPPVISTCAVQSSGVAELAAAADDFLAWSRETGRDRDRAHDRVRSQILGTTRDRLLELCLTAASERDTDLEDLIAAVAKGTLAPREASDRLIAQLVNIPATQATAQAK